VASALEIEQGRSVIGVLEHERRGLVDRDRAGAGGPVGMLSGMQAQCLEGGRSGDGHS